MSSSDISQFSGFSESDIPGDYNDTNIGVLYHISETCLGECITITFINKHDYESILGQLCNLYQFKINQQQTGQITQTLFGSEKLVINCYNTKKVVIQGKEAKLWKNTIFRTITQSLVKESVPAQPEQTLIKPTSKTPLKKAKSTSFIRKVSNTFFGPPVLNEMGKLGRELKKAKKAEKRGLAAVDMEELNRQLQTIQETGKKPSQKLHKMRRQFTPIRLTNVQNKCHLEEETSCKTVFSHDDDIVDDIDEGQTKSKTIDTQPLYEGQTTPTTLDNQPLDVQDSEGPLPNVYSDIESHILQKDDTIYQTQIDILQKEVSSLMERNYTLKILSKKQDLEMKKLNKENIQLKIGIQMAHDYQKKTTDLNAQNLILEEENSRLKNDLNKLNHENKRNLTTIRKNTLNSENNEEILNKMSHLIREVDIIKNTLNNVQAKAEKTASAADIGLLQANLKTFVRQEIADLKQRQDGHLESPESQNTPTPTSTPQLSPPSMSSNHQPSPLSANHHKENTKTVDRVKHIYILGDATTKYLDSRRLSGDKYKVTIRTNPDARIKDIDTKMKTLKEDNNLSSCDAILIHVGINNISDAETPEEIMNQYIQLISTSKLINNGAQIILSSLLLKKHDKLSAQTISKVNGKLQEVCDADQQLHFMNNTPQFMNESNVDTTMYLDETSLSHKGTANLAKNIFNAIHACLKTGYNTRANNGNFHWAQERRRMPRTQYQKLPSQMMMQQYWTRPQYRR